MTYNRIAAALAWLLGVFFTALALQNFGRLGVLLACVFALVTQAIFTIAERPIWWLVYRRRGGKLVFMGVLVTLIDGAINAAGIYPAIPALATSSVGYMFVHSFDLSPRIEGISAFVLAMTIGTFVAGLAEYLWELE